MFTGIIRAKEKIKSILLKNKSLFVEVVLPKTWKLKKGDSVSINGICSTIFKISKGSFEVEYMPETISKTTVLEWSERFFVNLERSLKLNDFVDGHLVSGHIDSTGKIIRIEIDGNSKIFTVEILKDFIKYIAPKGSVALDGVSLTVVDVKENHFTVSLVDYTLSNTNLNDKKVGELINVETDLIAKYIFNILNNAKETK